MRGDLLAIAALPLYLMMVIFLPANNVVLSNPLTCMPIVCVTGAYFIILTRNRKNAPPPALPAGDDAEIPAG